MNRWILCLLPWLSACATEPMGLFDQTGDESQVTLQREYADGSVYHGEAMGTVPHGRGVLEYADGTLYEGAFEQGFLSGEGRIEYPDGTVYEGLFLSDLAHGRGRAERTDGRLMEGRFERGVLQEGRHRTATGTLYEGRFENLVLVGEGRLTEHQGPTYRGWFDAGQRHGLFIRNPDQEDDYFEIWRHDQQIFSAPGPNRIRSLSDTGCSVLSRGSDSLVHLQGGCDENRAEGEGIALGQGGRLLLAGTFHQGALVDGGVLVLPDSTARLRLVSPTGDWARQLQIGGSDRGQAGDLIIGQWRDLLLDSASAQIFRAGQLMYDGEVRQGQIHGQGVCLSDGSPERCEHHQGQRVDASYLFARFEEDRRQVDETHRERLERIQAGIQRDRAQLRRQHEGALNSIDSRINRARNVEVTTGAIELFGAIMQDDQAAVERRRAEMEREVARLEQERERLQQQQLEEQERREQEWLRRQQDQVAEAEARYRQERSAVIREHRARCESLPGRVFNNNHECVRP